MGSQLLAVQQAGAPQFVHEDPFTKSKRVTDAAGAVVSAVETDLWGADTTRDSNAAFQPRRFTSYERDGNGSDEAMFRRYSRAQSRFEQPDPDEGSYNYSDPQSFNRYAYVQNDPVNFTDPTGLFRVCMPGSTIERRMIAVKPAHPGDPAEMEMSTRLKLVIQREAICQIWKELQGWLPEDEREALLQWGRKQADLMGDSAPWITPASET